MRNKSIPDPSPPCGQTQPVNQFHIMSDQSDAEATPRPLQLVQNTDVADRTPYIPRRKSSACNRSGSIFQDVSMVMSLDPPTKLLHAWPKHHNSVKNSCAPREGRGSSRASHAKLASRDEMYNAVSPVTWLTLVR